MALERRALIVGVEGLPGCGKTTLIRLLIQRLIAQSIRAYAVDIDTATGHPELRVYANTYPLTDPRHMMALWLLRMDQHDVMRVLAPDMDIIVSDRSWWSAVTIDGFGNGVSRQFLRMIGRHIMMPDIVLLLTAPLGVLQKRKGESRTLQDLAFARRVARGYRVLARMHGWHRVDATQTPECVKKDCLEIILRAYEEKLRS